METPQLLELLAAGPVIAAVKDEEGLAQALESEVSVLFLLYGDILTIRDTAEREGFSAAAASFHKIAEIEKLHGNRFGCLADLLEQGKLFVSDVKCAWMCLNCGHVFEGTAAPKFCPVCQHDQGFFIRLEMAPWTAAGIKS